MNSQKIITIILGIVGVISALFLFMIINTGDDAIKAGESNGVVTTFMYIAYMVLLIVIGIVLLFVFKGLLSGNIKKTLMTVGAFLAVVIISYIISSGTDLDLQPFIDKGVNLTEATSKLVGAGLYTFYFLAIIAIGSMLYGGSKKLSNNK